MKILFIFLFIAIFTLVVFNGPMKLSVFPSPSPTPIPSPTPRFNPLQVRASIPYWDQREAFNSFSQNVGVFNHLSLFWYYLSADGSINKYQYAVEDKNIIDFSRRNDVKVTAVLTNLPEKSGSAWDSERVEYILDNEDARSQLIREIGQLLDKLEFDGVTIDFEEVIKEERDNFSDFIKELSDYLHQQGKIVQVALHPKTGTQEDRYQFQDWQKISKSADQIYIMAYGEHYDEGEPGPIASLPWIEKIIDYALKLNLPFNKLYLGIPLYGYDWQDGEDKAVGLTYRQVQNLQKEFDIESLWDEVSKSPYFIYEKDGIKHEVWFENKESAFHKKQLAFKASFGGVTFWRLGGEDQKVWDLFNK